MTSAGNRKKRFFYHVKILTVYLTAAALLVVGSAVVSVNCRNIMTSDKITLFDVRQEEEGVVVTVMGKEFEIERGQKK